MKEMQTMKVKIDKFNYLNPFFHNMHPKSCQDQKSEIGRPTLPRWQHLRDVGSFCEKGVPIHLVLWQPGKVSRLLSYED